MSYFIQAKGTATGVTIDKANGIYMVSAPSHYQIDKSIPFIPTTGVKPGQKPTCEVNFLSDQIQSIEHGFIVFDASTTDATNSATWNNVCEFCKQIKVKNEQVKAKNEQKKDEITNETLK